MSGVLVGVDRPAACGVGHRRELCCARRARARRLRAVGRALVRIEGDAADGSTGKRSQRLRSGLERTLDEDVAYGFRLLVDMAERSLANSQFLDPTTAVQGIDRLHDGLRQSGASDPRRPGRRQRTAALHGSGDGLGRLCAPRVRRDPARRRAVTAGHSPAVAALKTSSSRPPGSTSSTPTSAGVARRRSAPFIKTATRHRFAMRPDSQGIGVAADAMRSSTLEPHRGFAAARGPIRDVRQAVLPTARRCDGSCSRARQSGEVVIGTTVGTTVLRGLVADVDADADDASAAWPGCMETTSVGMSDVASNRSWSSRAEGRDLREGLRHAAVTEELEPVERQAAPQPQQQLPAGPRTAASPFA